MFLTIACSKECKVNQPSQPPDKPDSIYFHNITPDTSFTSADTFVLHGSGGFYFALPTDSSVSYGFDVTNDSLEDFRFTIRQWYYFISASDPAGNYNYEIRFSGTRPGCSIKVPGNAQYPVADLLQKDMLIDSSGKYVRQTWIMMISAGAPFNCDFGGDAWIGFSVMESDTTYYGWVMVSKNYFATSIAGFNLTVKEWAITRTPGISIVTGQSSILTVKVL